METAINGESNFRSLTKLIRIIHSSLNIEELIDRCFWKGLNEMFPLWIKEYQLYISDLDEKTPTITRVLPKNNPINPSELNGLIMNCMTTRKDIYLNFKQTTSDKHYNRLFDLDLQPGFSLLTVPLISKISVNQITKAFEPSKVVGVL